ncbi:amino acid adenylation domain-containing protein, partial [Streptomyces sp. W16]|uniref:non-ribosomal peptide synthetase n=1 Tax=Streptomyces sp. W16 TaxID=3076631 RepID=UPI00295C23FC
MASTVASPRTVHADPEQTAFWRRRIAEHPEPTVLPRDFLGQDPEHPLATWSVAIGADTAAEIRRVTRNEPTLTRALHTAALAVAAARATDTGVVSVVTSAPDGSGHFPLAVPISPGTSLRRLLAAVRADYAEAARHLDAPVAPLFDRAGLVPSDLLIEVDGDGDGADAVAFPWTIRLDVRRDVAELTYRADLFTSATVRRLALAHVRVLDAVRSDPDAPLAEHLRADAQEEARLAEFNATEAEFPADTPLHGFLEATAAATPERVAIADDGTTYGELNRRANRLAHRLRALGVERGDVVGVCLPRSPLELTTLYAVLKAGAAYLPVDPTLPAARIAYVLEHSRTRVVLGDASTRHTAAAAQEFVDVSDPSAYAPQESDPDAGTRPADLAYVIYTSGSTGRPKGVMIEHRAIVNRLTWMQRAYPLTPDDVILHKTPFTFDVSLWEIFWWSLAGAAVCTLPSGDERDPERIAARVARHGVTTAHFVPSMLQAFLGLVEADDTAGRLRTLRQVFASGEALAAGQASAFRTLLGTPHGTRLVNLYGPTEAAVDVTHFPCAEADPARAVPIGRPIDNIRLHVLTRAGSVAPLGTPGELHIAGVGLARGYLGATGLTEERFVPDPNVPGERLYRTGDLARWMPDGTIEYLGRLDTQVKIRGHRVEPGEIEHVATRCGGVRECAVTTVPDGTGDRALCAYVVPGEGFQEAELREVFAAELPAYMVPGHIVTVPAIPTNHNGKRDVKSLPRPDRRGAAAFAAPRDAAEEQLARIWCEVLGLPRVGIDDNFFASGGDSIKFIGVLARARRAGLDFSFQDLFAHPTIAELSALARRTDSTHTTTAPFALLDTGDRKALPDDAVDAFPLSALQAGLLYEVARSGGGGLYHDVASYRVQDALDLDAFRAAVRTVVEHHAVFRTSFRPTGFSAPIQIVHATAPPPLGVVDLSDLPPAEQEARLEDHRADELRRGFAMGGTGLVRITVHLLGKRGYQYGLSYHAAALDGWSVGTVNRDLFAAYFALRDGGRPDFPPCATTYADYVRLEREAAGSTGQRAVWSRMLEGAEATGLPHWYEAPRPADEQPDVIMRDVPLPAEVSAAVPRVAERLRVPVKSVLLAAHTAVMGFVSGTDDVLTGYEHSGRPETPGAEHLPGLFLNTIPFRARLAPGTWADLIRHVYGTEAALLPARRVPLAELKRQLGVRGALFESVFNFTHFHVLKDLVRDRGFQLRRHDITSRTEFPFRAEFWQDAFTDEVHLSLHHHDGRFPPEQIDRIAGYYTRALELITTRTDDDRNCATLLGAAELRLLTEEFAGAEAELPPGTALDLIDAQVRIRPDAVAVTHRGELLTYAELDRASDRVAAFLRTSGVGHGDVVAMPMDRGLPWAVSVLGVLKAGAVYLPQDPADPPDRQAAMLRRSGCRHVLTTTAHARGLRAPSGPTVLRYEDAPDETGPVPRPGPDDPAYVIFTSGSTGEPKGALIHHRGMLNHLRAKTVDLGLGETDVVAQLATQCFDISVWQLLVAWLTGGRTVIHDKESVADLTGLLEALERDRISVLEVVPSYLDALLGTVSSPPPPLPGLRWVLVTGETLPPALTRRWFAAYDIPLVNAYGPTEASDDVTHHVLREPVDTERVPIGRPILNTRLYVLGPDDQLLPVGSHGEICVTGAGVGRGYVNDPERTARAFRANVLDSGSPTLYRTGDIGRWLPSGVLDCAGRADHQVKVRGFRVELSEIEGALTRLPGIDQAVVLVRRTGGERRLVAFCTGPAVPGPAQAHDALAATLPAHLLPDLVLPLDALPLTRNGKADRAALERHPLPARTAGAGRVPPADDDEAALLAQFADVLDVEPGELSVTDDFFDAGGHSLAAMKLTARLGRGLALRDVLDHPTVRSLARRLTEGAAATRPLLTELLPCARPLATLVCV